MSSAADLTGMGDRVSDLRERKKDSFSTSNTNGVEQPLEPEHDSSKERDQVTRGKTPDGTGTHPVCARPYTSFQRASNARCPVVDFQSIETEIILRYFSVGCFGPATRTIYNSTWVD